jgi:Sensors of blue-light using FAD
VDNLVHLVYASRATVEFSDDMILELLALARAKNKSLGITGMLVYSESSFFQVLEGEQQAVLDLFARIKRDERHAGTVTIIHEPIAVRGFKNWSMGYSSLPRSELGRIEGMNDFFVGQTCLTDVDEGRAKLLLESFAQGRWRQAG